jgi:hypothetical protein
MQRLLAKATLATMIGAVAREHSNLELCTASTLQYSCGMRYSAAMSAHANVSTLLSTHLCPVREDAVCLYELLREVVIKPLQ